MLQSGRVRTQGSHIEATPMQTSSLTCQTCDAHPKYDDTHANNEFLLLVKSILKVDQKATAARRRKRRMQRRQRPHPCRAMCGPKAALEYFFKDRFEPMRPHLGRRLKVAPRSGRPLLPVLCELLVDEEVHADNVIDAKVAVLLNQHPSGGVGGPRPWLRQR